MSELAPWVVIVDDDPSFVRAFDRMIRSHGMTSSTFSSALDFLSALERVSECVPSCLVLDVHMPGIGGLLLQQTLKDAGHEIPLILISGHDDSAVRDKALEAGAIAFLYKPFTDTAFIECLNLALASRHSTGLPGSKPSHIDPTTLEEAGP